MAIFVSMVLFSHSSYTSVLLFYLCFWLYFYLSSGLGILFNGFYLSSSPLFLEKCFVFLFFNVFFLFLFLFFVIINAILLEFTSLSSFLDSVNSSLLYTRIMEVLHKFVVFKYISDLNVNVIRYNNKNT